MVPPQHRWCREKCVQLYNSHRSWQSVQNGVDMDGKPWVVDKPNFLSISCYFLAAVFYQMPMQINIQVLQQGNMLILNHVGDCHGVTIETECSMMPKMVILCLYHYPQGILEWFHTAHGFSMLDVVVHYNGSMFPHVDLADLKMSLILCNYPHRDGFLNSLSTKQGIFYQNWTYFSF